MDDEFFVAPWSGSNPAVEFNRGGENKAVVVVGVLPDNIYAAWRTINGGRGSKARAKLFLKLGRISQRSVLFQICLRPRRRICGAGGGKIGDADANYGVPGRNVFRLFRPDAVDAAVHGRQAVVIADEAALGIERLIGPGIVLKRLTSIGRARENHRLCAVSRVAAAVVEDDVD